MPAQLSSRPLPGLVTMTALSVAPEVPPVPPQPQPSNIRFAPPADDAFVDELQAAAFGPGRFRHHPCRLPPRFRSDDAHGEVE